MSAEHGERRKALGWDRHCVQCVCTSACLCFLLVLNRSSFICLTLRFQTRRLKLSCFCSPLVIQDAGEMSVQWCSLHLREPPHSKWAEKLCRKWICTSTYFTPSSPSYPHLLLTFSLFHFVSLPKTHFLNDNRCSNLLISKFATCVTPCFPQWNGPLFISTCGTGHTHAPRHGANRVGSRGCFGNTLSCQETGVAF